MGKAGRWLRSFLTGKKDKKAARDDKGKTDGRPTPTVKEKRRWSFRRPAAAVTGKDASTSTSQGHLASTSSHCFSEVLHVVVEDQHAAAASEVTIAVDPPASKGGNEEAAAVKIQSAFRSYLARKALCALRGMVKLQAMVRGQLVRRQADMTLRRIQALVVAQRRARAERLRLLEDGKPAAGTPRPRTSRRSPQHHRSSRKPLASANDHAEVTLEKMPMSNVSYVRLAMAMKEAADGEENVKVVEVDDGGSEARGRRSSFCSTPGRAELYQKTSATLSGLTDATARTFSGRFEELSASFSAVSEASERHRGGKACHADHAIAAAALLLPKSYMANTESSRAKARSQSAPRHRHSEAAAASSPSRERPPTGSGGRRRASLDPRDLAGGGRAASPRISSGGAAMERCASQAVRLDRPSVSVSLPGSECGSSCTMPTSARIA